MDGWLLERRAEGKIDFSRTDGDKVGGSATRCDGAVGTRGGEGWRGGCCGWGLRDGGMWDCRVARREHMFREGWYGCMYGRANS